MFVCFHLPYQGLMLLLLKYYVRACALQYPLTEPPNRSKRTLLQWNHGLVIRLYYFFAILKCFQYGFEIESFTMKRKWECRLCSLSELEFGNDFRSIGMWFCSNKIVVFKFEWLHGFGCYYLWNKNLNSNYFLNLTEGWGPLQTARVMRTITELYNKAFHMAFYYL